MKTAKKEKPMWDFYYDKQLETLLQEYEFDFGRVAETFNMITESDIYTKDNCEDRYTEIYKERKRGEYSRLEEDMEALEGGKPRKKTIYEVFKDLPVERVPKNNLKVTSEDLDNAFSVSAITGEIIRPTGRNLMTKSRVQCSL
jgi:hypothetical protein